MLIYLMICHKCEENKPETDFAWENKAKGIRHKYCKICHNSEYGRVWYQKNRTKQIRMVAERRRRYKGQNRSFLVEYFKTHPCVDCGETNPVVLELDHIDRKSKKEAVGKLMSDGHSPQVVENELSKCVVRCANCHRIKTSKEQDWYKVRK